MRRCLTFWLEVRRRGSDPAREVSFLLSYPRSLGPGQVLEELRTSVPAGIATDLVGNSWLRVEADSIEDAFSFRYDSVVTTPGVVYDVGSMRRLAGGEAPADGAFLRSEAGIEADAPAIRRAAEGLGGRRPEEVVAAAQGFVRSRVRYVLQGEERGALAGLERGEGDCTELAALLVALARARGIPARVVLGRFGGSSGLHAIAEVRLAGAWVPLDVTNQARPVFGMPADWITLFQKNWIGGDRADCQFSIRYRSPGRDARLETTDRQRLRKLAGAGPRRGHVVDAGPAPGPFRVEVARTGRSVRVAVESECGVALPADLVLSTGRSPLRVVGVLPLVSRPGTRLEREIEGTGRLRADLVDRSGRVLASAVGG